MAQGNKANAKPKDAPALTGADDLPDLTPKQRKFVQSLLEGKTASDAYRAAYDCSKMTRETVWARASELRRDGKVAAWLSRLRLAALGEGVVTLEAHMANLDRLIEKAIENKPPAAAWQRSPPG